MPRHDDDLQQIARDRLRAVAGRRLAGAAEAEGTSRATEPAPPRWSPVRLGDEIGRQTARAPERVGAQRVDAGGGAGPPPADVGDEARPGTPQPLPAADAAGAPVQTQARDVVARVRAEALAAASATYADTHGHPLDRSGDTAPRRRWYLSLRHAVVAGVAVTVLAAGVVIRTLVSVPDGPEPLAASVAADGVDPVVSGAPSVPGTSGDGVGTVGGVPGAVAPGAVASGGAPGPGGQAPAGGVPAGVAGAVATPGATAPDGARVVVHVVGQVGRPGVVELPTGSRVADALAAVGGATSAADLSAVNLARVVADGEQIVVPAPGEAPPPVPGPVAAGSSAGGSPGNLSALGSASSGVAVDLNTAGLAELDGLPGIGPVLAQRILDWRAANGPFRQVDELGEVAGVGDALLQRLAPLVRV